MLVFVSVNTYAQLGSCPGSKGDPIFTENFGNGMTYGPALPAGITTYAFIPGPPQDGQYTLFYHSNQYSTWHYSLDHTPDVTNGPNGKMLLMNANAVTSGDFYKKTVSGLCINTTFEFSSWLMNVYNPNTNYCGANQIPINVRFEIWNASETILLGSGNTGNIMGSTTPTWQQFALVFTTVNETSVVLKMKNNGLGGCGNDLAIDDIEFRSCGDLTTVSSPLATGSTYTTCDNPVSLQLQASTAGGSTYFYQWQESTNGTTWTDIPGATNPSYTTPNLTVQTYYRVKAAQDAANLANAFCSTLSNVFTVAILPSPNPATSNGNAAICGTDPIPALSVTSDPGTGVNWYSTLTGGTLLQAASNSYTPPAAGTYYAEAYNLTSNCVSSPRTGVTLSIVALPNATISGSAAICSGNSATVSFSGTPNSILTYVVDGGTSQTIALNGSGTASITTPVLTSNSTYTLVSAASPSPGSCIRTINTSVTITVNNSATASITASAGTVCAGSSATINFIGTPNATVTYKVNTGANQTVLLNASGTASITGTITATTTYELIQVSLGGLCTQALNQILTISAVAIPTGAISANPLVICSNQTSTISFSGTPNAILTYTINGGANQTVALNASGSASVVTAAGLTSDVTYQLISATSSALNTCSSALTGTVNIQVNTLPTASISSNSPVCAGSAATVTFTGTPNAIVTYSVNSGTNLTAALNGSGNASVATSAITSATAYTLISVTSAGANSCTRPLSQSITISPIALPTASISANPATVCSNQTSTVSINGTPNSTVTYSINGGASQSAVLNASGIASITVNPMTANTTYQLLNITLPGSGCSQSLSGAVTISMNPAPIATYSGDLIYCDGETATINLSSDTAGATFNWTVVSNGTSGAVAGNGNQISQVLTLTGDTTGTVTYTVTPTFNGCSGIPVQIIIEVHQLPVPQIADGVICLNSGPPSSQFYTLDTNLSAAGHIFQWLFEGDVIAGAAGNTYNATQIGTYTVIATSLSGCVSDPVDAEVSEMSQGESLTIQQSAAFSDNQSITVTVNGGDGPYLYQLDDAGFQSENVFYNVSAGTHLITVVDSFCTNLTANVNIINYPKFFTPNGDGFHDTWNITGVSGITSIFDRYGKLLKQISPDGNGWDGTFNGHLLPSTDYWFSIDYDENGSKKTFRAHFAMKR